MQKNAIFRRFFVHLAPARPSELAFDAVKAIVSSLRRRHAQLLKGVAFG